MKKDERGWQVSEMYVLSVTAAMSTVTIGERKVKDANGRGGCEYRRSRLPTDDDDDFFKFDQFGEDHKKAGILGCLICLSILSSPLVAFPPEDKLIFKKI
jgi:hypothetical protein